MGGAFLLHSLAGPQKNTPGRFDCGAGVLKNAC